MAGRETSASARRCGKGSFLRRWLSSPLGNSEFGKTSIGRNDQTGKKESFVKCEEWEGMTKLQRMPRRVLRFEEKKLTGLSPPCWPLTAPDGNLFLWRRDSLAVHPLVAGRCLRQKSVQRESPEAKSSPLPCLCGQGSSGYARLGWLASQSRKRRVWNALDAGERKTKQRIPPKAQTSGLRLAKKGRFAYAGKRKFCGDWRPSGAWIREEEAG